MGQRPLYCALAGGHRMVRCFSRRTIRRGVARPLQSSDGLAVALVARLDQAPDGPASLAGRSGGDVVVRSNSRRRTVWFQASVDRRVPESGQTPAGVLRYPSGDAGPSGGLGRMVRRLLLPLLHLVASSSSSTRRPWIASTLGLPRQLP